MIVRSVVVPTREARVVETTRVIDTSPTKRNDLGPVQSRLGGKQSLSTGTVLRVTNLASTVSGEDMKARAALNAISQAHTPMHSVLMCTCSCVGSV